MPFSKLKIILERITINTLTEIVCCGNLQFEKSSKLSKKYQIVYVFVERRHMICCRVTFHHNLVIKLNNKQDVL